MRSTRASAVMLLLLPLIVVQNGCAADGRIELQVLVPVAPDPYAGVTRLRFDILAEGRLEDSETVTFEGPGSVRTRFRVTPGPGLSVVLRGIDADDNIVSAGRSAPVTVPAGGVANVSLVFGQRGTFSELGPMLEPRAAHTATLLGDGRVLVAGGLTVLMPPSWALSLEVYDPACACFILLTDSIPPRVYHAATLMADGRVLIYGGIGVAGSLDDAYLVDATAGTVAMVGNALPDLSMHAAVRADLDVLFSGFNTAFRMSLSGNAATTTTLAAGIPNFVGGAVAKLADGEALVAGGLSAPIPGMAPPVSQVGVLDEDGSRPLNPSAGDAVMLVPRSSLTATLLSDGKVLLFGGDSAAGLRALPEIYDPQTDGIFDASTDGALARAAHTATSLPGTSGEVLLAGGFPGGVEAQLFQPDDDPATPDLYEAEFRSIGLMRYDRWSHTATALDDGSVLLLGGIDSSGLGVAPVEVFIP